METIVVDVREPYEYSSGHYKGAINLPPAEIMSGAKKLAKVPKDAKIVLYCKSGARSNVAMVHLSRLGYTNLVNGINQDHVPRFL
jgi:phage shock protein E